MEWDFPLSWDCEEDSILITYNHSPQAEKCSVLIKQLKAQKLK